MIGNGKTTKTKKTTMTTGSSSIKYQTNNGGNIVGKKKGTKGKAKKAKQ
jgi:hypothetical protein